MEVSTFSRCVSCAFEKASLVKNGSVALHAEGASTEAIGEEGHSSGNFKLFRAAKFTERRVKALISFALVDAIRRVPAKLLRSRSFQRSGNFSRIKVLSKRNQSYARLVFFGDSFPAAAGRNQKPSAPLRYPGGEGQPRARPTNDESKRLRENNKGAGQQRSSVRTSARDDVINQTWNDE